MCGITCTLHFHHQPKDVGPKLESEIDESLDLVRHRGPDARGKWVSPDCRVGLGHVRLSIIDPSPQGDQPFHDYKDGIHAVVNGELYNHEQYRKELAQEFEFKGNSDCEVVIALYKHYGITFLSRLRGEFALVLWDEKRQLFFAGRDRFGIKSLYYTVVNNRLLVATEMKSFLPYGWKPEWCIPTLRSHEYDFGWKTIFKGVYNVRPGHYLRSQGFGPVEQSVYWDCEYPDKRVLETRSEAEMIEGLRERLLEAVRIRLRADVPVGVYLSGGVDSSSIAGMMSHLIKEEGSRLGSGGDGEATRLHCFSVEFDKTSGFDESDAARRTAEKLGAQFHPVRVDERALASAFEDTVWASESTLPDLCGGGKLILAEAAHKEGIKVVLTGEGADEHLAGYPTYQPDAIREEDPSWPTSSVTDADRMNKLETLLQGWTYPSPQGITEAIKHMLNHTYNASDVSDMCVLPFAAWTDVHDKLHPIVALAESLDGRTRHLIDTKWHPLHTAEYLSIKTLLPTYILRHAGDNVDMMHQVESRPPFLDHHVTEYANGIPPSLKVPFNPVEKTFREKYILREAMRPFITDEVYSSRKKSYLAPSKYDVNGPVHQLFTRLVTKENVENIGFLDWDKTKSNLEKAFGDGKDEMAYRVTLSVAQYVVLSQRFGVGQAQDTSKGKANGFCHECLDEVK
ncbi:hypothetical protein N7492_003217 [Penicillium capsulatum]|uniref:Glutamine amidotransferase type-2 domain-containing protein n=1 Tax=Penicillium capsulatum TaxID=69766 RepID=A0A9W9LX64_9EURO|nr:hypothetical protein N7492_003217 [Penicillium capsulatum]KAJ6122196.1 hypothetical protein N7512_004661 [Penicillium capsulatum]